MASLSIPPPTLLRPDEVPKDFVCSVCHDVPTEPVVTACHHFFCRECLAESWKRAPLCPMDRQPLQQHEISQAPVGMIRRIWSEIAIECGMKDCTWKGTMGDYQEHLERSCESRRQQQAAFRRDEAAVRELEEEIQQLRAEHEWKDSEIARLQAARHRLSVLHRDEARERELEEEIQQLQAEHQWKDSEIARLHLERQQLERDLRSENFTISTRLGYQIAELERENQNLRQRQGRARTTADDSYRYDRRRVVELSQFICRYLNDKPSNIDSNRILNCIRNCTRDWQKNWADNPRGFDKNMRMLIHVALASNWFTDNQRRQIGWCRDDMA